MPFQTLFHLDHLSIIMISLITCIGVSILLFSSRYMHGDIKYNSFRIKIVLLLFSLILMVSTDNILLFLMAWFFSNGLLVTLIVHKSQWKAAYNSGLIAAKNFFFGFISLAIGFLILYRASGEVSITKISALALSNPQFYIASIFILIAAMTQSAIWPFHRWLLSSLNAPTPVSAIMHAGLVNGGGFLLTRFASLWIHSPRLLNIIFILGIVTAFYGTLWKLLQPDIKKMLACSTVGQMGFMFVQCGLGLFSGAIAHLCWHGFFKAYLFLNSPSAHQEKKLPILQSANAISICFSALGGLSGVLFFILTGGDDFSFYNSTIVIVSVVFIASYQLSLTITERCSLKNIILMFLITMLLGSTYGLNFRFVENFLSPLKLFQPQPLNIFYLVGIMILGGSWIYRVYQLYKPKRSPSNWYLKKYVSMINASQPDPSTITTYRNDYQYK